MKRTDRFIYNTFSKKPKLQLPEAEKLADDIWGDDLAPEDVDKCIEFACSQANESIILETYTDFNTKNRYCSTQIPQTFAVPSTSKGFMQQENPLQNISSMIKDNAVIQKDVSVQEYERKLVEEINSWKLKHEKLTEKFMNKQGEVEILRSQIKQTNLTVKNEQIKAIENTNNNVKLLSEKLNLVTKDADSLKADNELKNLEIVNLKEKITEIKRIHGEKLFLFLHENSELYNQTSHKIKKNSNSESNIQKDASIQTCKQTICVMSNNMLNNPLAKIIPCNFFDIHHTDDAIIQLNKSNDGSRLLFRHNLSYTQSDNIINIQSRSIFDKRKSPVRHLYSEISYLIDCMEEELNCEDICPKINKIIIFTKELLYHLKKDLRRIESSICSEDIRDMDCTYLDQKINNLKLCIFSGRAWCENEAGIDLRRYIGVLAATALYNSYLVNYLTGQSSLHFDFKDLSSLKTKYSIENLESTNENITINKCDFLSILLDVTKLIGKIRRSHQFPGLLSSILKLLNNLFLQKGSFVNCYSVIHSIFKEIIFSRPNGSVLTYATEFLKNSASHNQFVTLLCSNSSNATFTTDIKKEILLFTQETCTFQIAATIMEGYEKNVEIACNFIQFLHSATTNNLIWMYPQENQYCQCLVKLYTIAIDLVYELSEEFLIERHNIKDTTILQYYYTTFRIGLLLLHVLTVRIPELILKYASSYSQYQRIIKNIEQMQSYLNFETTHRTALKILLLNEKTEVKTMLPDDRRTNHMKLILQQSYTNLEESL